MPVNITIIGLGKIGASAGLALAKHNEQIHRIGHDLFPDVARRAQKLGAIDKAVFNLPASVAEADIVLLALPIDQIRDTLKFMTHDLKEGVVVLDTSPVKTAVAAWAKEFLLPDRHYVGLTPVINPLHMFMEETGLDGARQDLFENGLMGIAAPQGTVAAALKLAVDLTGLLGAKPLFLDLVEVDSLMAAAHVVPQLAAAALAGATSNQPGWTAGRKVAGAAYARATAAFGAIDSGESLAHAAGLNREHVTRILDNVIRELVEFKSLMQEADPAAMANALAEIKKARQDWLAKSRSGDWGEGPPTTDVPTSADEMRRWVLGRRRESGGR